jgi:hypothetical protein
VNVSEELARLAQLRDQGILSEDEFQTQKAAVLGGQHSAAPTAPAMPIAPAGGGTKKAIGIGCAVLLALIVLLVIIGSVVGGGAKQGASTETANAGPPTPVTAIELFNAYQANEAAAQQRYGNKRLLVSGTVDGVDLDFSDKPVVKLRTSNQFMSASANLTEASQAKATGLAKGTNVKLLCGGVSEVIGMPQLSDCEIQ